MSQQFKQGDKVDYYPIIPTEGMTVGRMQSTVLSEPQPLEDGSVLCKIEGMTNAVNIEHLKPHQVREDVSAFMRDQLVDKKGFCTIIWNNYPFITASIVFHYPKDDVYILHNYDQYMRTAIEKAEKVKEDPHLITSSLMYGYRWAIREGYNHMLDPHLRDKYDQPRNRNTIKGIEGYVAKINKASDEEMKAIMED